MKGLFSVLLFAISASLYSQVKTLSEVVEKNKVEARNNALEFDRLLSVSASEAKMLIEPIAYNTNEYSFRFSFNYNTITVYKNGDNVFGSMTIAVDEAYSPDAKLFKMTRALSNDQVNTILVLIDSTAIDTIPSMEYISGWRQGFDGGTYTLQEKEISKYTIKDYWSPTLFPSISQAVAIEQFKDKLLSIVNFSEIYDVFSKYIPFEAYNFGGGLTAVKILSHEEYRKKKREERSKKRRQ